MKQFHCFFVSALNSTIRDIQTTLEGLKIDQDLVDLGSELEDFKEHSIKNNKDLFDLVSMVKEKCENKSSNLQVMINDIETQMSLDRKQTTKKGMTIMEQISDISSSFTLLQRQFFNKSSHVDKDLSYIKDRMDGNKADLQELIDDIETQLNSKTNQTVQKGMTLMRQISDLTSNLTILEDKFQDKNELVDAQATHLQEMIDDIETQLNLNRNQTTHKGMTLMGQISVQSQIPCD